MKRFSVLYLLNEHFHHIGCGTHAQAESLLQRLLIDSKRSPVGIYDAKTELFANGPITSLVLVSRESWVIRLLPLPKPYAVKIQVGRVWLTFKSRLFRLNIR